MLDHYDTVDGIFTRPNSVLQTFVNKSPSLSKGSQSVYGGTQSGYGGSQSVYGGTQPRFGGLQFACSESKLVYDGSQYDSQSLFNESQSFHNETSSVYNGLPYSCINYDVLHKNQLGSNNFQSNKGQLYNESQFNNRKQQTNNGLQPDYRRLQKPNSKDFLFSYNPTGSFYDAIEQPILYDEYKQPITYGKQHIASSAMVYGKQHIASSAMVSSSASAAKAEAERRRCCEHEAVFPDNDSDEDDTYNVPIQLNDNARRR